MAARACSSCLTPMREGDQYCRQCGRAYAGTRAVSQPVDVVGHQAAARTLLLALPERWPDTLRYVGWLTVVLGLSLQLLVLAPRAIIGDLHGVRPIVGDLVQQVSWAFFVCAGIVLAITSEQVRPRTVGLTGLLSAPVAFVIARTLHRAVNQALGLSSFAPTDGFSVAIVLLKAAEYGCLGAWVAWLQARQQVSALQHIAVGLAVGAVFGGATLLVLATVSPDALSGAAFFSRTVNELLFPAGCSLILFAIDQLLESAARNARTA